MSAPLDTPSKAGQGTIYLADDEAAVRDALCFLFASHGLEAHAFGTGRALLEALTQPTPSPACILLDVRMEPMSGLQVFDKLRLRANNLPVIFLSGHGDIAMAVEALKLGAFDFIEKPFHDAALIERVRKALQACTAATERRSSTRTLRERIEGLSTRERELMHHVAAGKLNKIIADEMHISMRTVEVHRSRVFAKLGVRSAAELATLLARADL